MGGTHSWQDLRRQSAMTVQEVAETNSYIFKINDCITKHDSSINQSFRARCRLPQVLLQRRRNKVRIVVKINYSAKATLYRIPLHMVQLIGVGTTCSRPKDKLLCFYIQVKERWSSYYCLPSWFCCLVGSLLNKSTQPQTVLYALTCLALTVLKAPATHVVMNPRQIVRMPVCRLCKIYQGTMDVASMLTTTQLIPTV